MRQAPLYSRSRRAPAGAVSAAPDAPASPVTAVAPSTDPATLPPPVAATAQPPARWRRWFGRHERMLWGLSGAILVLGGVAAWQALNPGARALTQADIDAAVRHSLEKEPLPSAYAKAYEIIRPSVVRVVGSDGDEADPAKAEAMPDAKRAKPVPLPKAAKPVPGDRKKQTASDTPEPGEPHLSTSTGSGVVIIDNGTILTNLHVVQGSKKLRVTFADGFESDATVVGIEPEHDLAVLRAKSIPDDLQAATMRSASDLQAGDQVIAVGYPFGIGPSVSGGVISGLKRDFRSPQGQRLLNNLIQFDAAANPGNSGGPLVTMDGSVVGIVTAILNPTEHRTFIGIGFAVPIDSAAGAAGMPPF
ncbi:trypsin-like peptidase domain-containing protein [Rhizobacter sp. P5_C2]